MKWHHTHLQSGRSLFKSGLSHRWTLPISKWGSKPTGRLLVLQTGKVFPVKRTSCYGFKSRDLHEVIKMGKKKCAICKLRPSNSGISNHHLVPKFNGNTRSGKTPLCLDCHQRIHDHFSNRELFEEFNNLESLKRGLAERMLHEALDGFSFLLDEAETTTANHEHASISQLGREPALYHDVGERDVGGSTPSTGFQPSFERSYETIGGRL